MTRKTVSFHVSSATANANSDNTSFSIDLVPELDVGHTAEPTVYLHNLSFVNTFANVSKDLYDNATVTLAGGNCGPSKRQRAVGECGYMLSQLG